MKLKQNDWDVLFIAQDFLIGTTTIKLVPLSLQDLPAIVSEFVKIRDSILSSDVTVNNYVSKVSKLSTMIATKAPGLISIMSGLHVDDVKKLPITVVIALLTACIEINTKDQKNFLKNLMALADKIGNIATISEVISAT